VAGRRDEKERLRREREEAERAAAAGDARRRRLAIALGGVLVTAVAVVAALAIAAGGDGEAPPPPNGTTDVAAAARAAGCTFREFPDEGNRHLRGPNATFDGYRTNPPTSGPHREPPAPADGIYAPGRSPDPEAWVHSLEHGRVILMYAPGTPERRRRQVEALMEEPFGGHPAGYKTIVMENDTGMPFAVAAVSWRRYVGCRRVTDRSFGALRAFRAAFVESPEAPERDFPWPAG
jgi:hypothetical protein